MLETCKMNWTLRDIEISGWCVALLVLSVSVGWCQTTTVPWQLLQATYEYDADLPLQAQVTETGTNSFFTSYSVTIEAVDGTTIPAMLHRPNLPEPVPCVLLLHGLGGDKASYSLPLALALAPKGVAVMAIDARLHGERAEPDTQMLSADLAASRDAMINTIIDNRRALDYLDTRLDIAHERYMLIGASLGGIQGAMLAAVDERIKSAVLIVAGGQLDAMFLSSKHPATETFREAGYSAGALRRALWDVEPVNFIGHFAPRPLLMINGAQDDTIPPENATALHRAADEPKQIVWYEGGHIPPISQLISLLGEFIQANLLELE
jgi:pimeloyl-ACP methyl ester carboxylesterase